MKIKILAALILAPFLLTACGNNNNEPTESEIKTLLDDGFKKLYGESIVKEVKKLEPCTRTAEDIASCELSFSFALPTQKNNSSQIQTMNGPFIFHKVDGKWVIGEDEPAESEIKTMTENGFKTLYPNGEIVLSALKKKECTNAGKDAVRCTLSITVETKNPATGETKSQTQEPTIMFRKVGGKWVDVEGEPSENEIRAMTEKGLKTLYPNGEIALKELKKKECTNAGTDAVRCTLNITVETKNPATGETINQTVEPTIMFRWVDGKWVDAVN